MKRWKLQFSSGSGLISPITFKKAFFKFPSNRSTLLATYSYEITPPTTASISPVTTATTPTIFPTTATVTATPATTFTAAATATITAFRRATKERGGELPWPFF